MIGIGIVIIVLFLFLRSCGSEGESGDEATFNVNRGPLTISVTESGTINFRNQIVIKNEVEGRTTILYLIREGVKVKKGELLVELDASPLQDRLVDQQIRVENTQAAFVRARENLDVVKSESASSLEKSELDLRFADQDLKKYIEGEYPNELSKAESDITVAKEELSRAEERLKWSQVLFNEKYLSQTELQADELAAKKARLSLDQAVSARDLLVEYTHTKRLAELESNAKQSVMALDRTKKKTGADVIQAEADLKAKDSEFKRESDKLEKLNKQISKTKIYAPNDGLVVYPTSGKGFFSFSEEPLQEGKEVREREELIYLPAADSVLAEVKLNESLLDKVKIGLPVRITVAALPDQIFTGKVFSIAPLPDAGSGFLGSDVKVFNSEIYIDKSGGALRTGMSCEVEIIIAHYDDVLYVPVQAVTRHEGQPVVYVRRRGGFEPRQVELGLDNNNMVHIKKGVEKDEEVWLTPPIEAMVFNDSPDSLSENLQDALDEAEKNPLQDPVSPEIKLPDDPEKMLEKLKEEMGDDLPEELQDIDIKEIMQDAPGDVSITPPN